MFFDTFSVSNSCREIIEGLRTAILTVSKFQFSSLLVDLRASQREMSHHLDFMPHYLIMFHCFVNTPKLSGLVSVDR